MGSRLDQLDVSILRQLLSKPRMGERELSRILGIARGTVHARVRKLEDGGVIAGYEPNLSPKAMGYTGLAFVRLNLAQGVLDEVTAGLAAIPEVTEAYSVAGDSDLLCQVVSKGPEDLEEAIQRILTVPGVMRSRTETVLRRRIPRRVGPLLARLEED